MFAYFTIFIITCFSIFSSLHSIENVSQKSFEEETENLKALNSFIQNCVSHISKDFYDLHDRVSKELLPNYIVLNFRENKFQKLNTNVGHFFISPEKAIPYLDGYKVVIQIGNPFNCIFCDPEFYISWMMPYENSKEKGLTPTEWSNTKKEKEVSILARIEPGKWNNIELILTPCTLEELENVMMCELEFRSVNFKTN